VGNHHHLMQEKTKEQIVKLISVDVYRSEEYISHVKKLIFLFKIVDV
jgi:hypothetical protein